jgi:hypothetical protein
MHADLEIPEFLRRPNAKEREEMAGRRKKPETTETPASIDTPESDTAAPGPGHNSRATKPAEMTEDQRQALALQWKRKYEADLGAKKAADAALKNTGKLIKAELGAEGLDLIKDMILLETDDGEAQLRARAERARRAAIYMAAPLGSQFEFFPDRMPAEDRAFAEGKRDAMSGEPLVNPYDPSVPQFGQYAEGWHAGQRALIDAQKARDDRDFGTVSPEEAAALAAVEAHGIAGASNGHATAH